jgi:hypothetical protein
VTENILKVLLAGGLSEEHRPSSAIKQDNCITDSGHTVDTVGRSRRRLAERATTLGPLGHVSCIEILLTTVLELPFY